MTTTWLVVLLGIAGLLVFAGAHGEWTSTNMALFPDWVYDGRVWTLLTWPFAVIQGADVFWTVLTIFFFWYFGSDLERSALGKKRFLWMLLIWTVALGLLLLAMSELNTPDAIYGLNLLELMVLLLWTAEWPTRMFFFNIPAWLIGLVLAGIQVIAYLGDGRWTLLLVFLSGAVVCGFVARQFGMLAEYPWIPKLGAPHRQPRPPRPAKPRKRDFDPGRPTVVSGPWTPPASRPAPPPSRDEQRMDELLEKIHESGTASLTEAEQAELRELSARRRRQS
ncbi:DUF6576 domain-containing protein [Nocardioides cheoyonin]|uniref:DUF6576 domain-containing protein n=1 Tax=Nocardioides cheoyonin TaxID=3156615 RepID=UPI0032B48B73